jgi:2-dehydro-3-deoxyphosphogluconate aldolase / (4S)-4-hydroxy-2-oxoglutarate aldolase
MSRAEVVARIEQEGIVAIIRLDDAAVIAPLVDALVAGGVRVVEITMTVPTAIASIRRLASSASPNVVIGAGTVLDPETARCAIDAGARFVVAPVLRPGVIDACHERDTPAIPGGYTATEILDAWESGADIVKVFPANSLGPSFLKDVREPLPHVKLMPTGGVSIDNVGDWFRAGAVAVGVGGALVDRQAIASRDFAAITLRAERIVANARAARARP